MATRTGTETRKRGRILTARFNEQEASAIRQLADKSGLSVGSLIRRALLNAAPPRALHRPNVDQQAVARVLAQLGKIGSNINQLAKYANMGRFQSDSIEMALRDLMELRLVCMQALGHELDHEHANDAAAHTP